MQKYRNRLIIGFAMSILIYAVYLFAAELIADESAFDYLPLFPFWLLLPLTLLQGVATFCRWVEWHYYLGVVGAQDKLSIMDSIVLQVASFTMAVSPGKAGELLKSVVLKTKTGTDVSVSAPVVLAERVVDGLAVLTLMALAVWVGGPLVALQEWQRDSIILSVVLLVGGLVAVQIKPLAYFFLNLLRRLPLLRRMYGALKDFYDSSREVFRLRHVIPMVFVGMGVYGSSILMMFLILIGFGEAPTWTLFLQATIFAGVSSALGALSGSPNGAGVTEGTIQWMLMVTLGFGPGLALAAGLLHGFFNKWLRVFVGMAVGFIFRDRLFVENFEAALDEAEQALHQKQQATVGG